MQLIFLVLYHGNLDLNEITETGKIFEETAGILRITSIIHIRKFRFFFFVSFFCFHAAWCQGFATLTIRYFPHLFKSKIASFIVVFFQ